MQTLSERVVVITGAASGIGRATAEAFASAGCRLAVVDIDEKQLEATLQTLKTARPDTTARGYGVDVSDADAVDELAESIVEDFGAVHVVINNAGINVTGHFDDHSLEDFRRAFDVNLWGVIHGCQSFLPHLKTADEGHIVNISSLFGIVGTAGQSAYCASKFAVRGLTESLHEELRDTHVGVTVVHPGCVNTNIIRDATIHDEDAVGDIREYFDEHGCPPQAVAERILEAVRNGQHRVLITPESHVFDLLRRIAPTAGNHIANRLMSKMLGFGLE